jgi:hypothetical protein
MDDDEFATMLDDRGISLSVDGTGYVGSCLGSNDRRHVVSRTYQREANGVLALAVHVCIRDQNVIEDLVCKFISSSLREKECILRICQVSAP